MDPRNPKRPDGDTGSNWVTCRDCGRGASSIKLIRHTGRCVWRTTAPTSTKTGATHKH